MMVPSWRSVIVDRSPDMEKVDRKHQLRDSVKLKHFGIFGIYCFCGEVYRIRLTKVRC